MGRELGLEFEGFERDWDFQGDGVGVGMIVGIVLNEENLGTVLARSHFFISVFKTSESMTVKSIQVSRCSKCLMLALHFYDTMPIALPRHTLYNHNLP